MVTASLQALTALMLGALSVYTSYVLARRALPDVPVSVRWCGTGTICLWLLLALFQGLARLEIFYLYAAFAAWIILAAGAWALYGRQVNTLRLLAGDLATLVGRVRQAWSSGDAWVYVIGSGLVLFYGACMLVAPPLDWDSLLHHLFVAAQWVRHGGMFAVEAPDCWPLYEALPANAEALAGWFMLPFHGDRLVGLVNFLAWGLALAAFYALAREFGVRARYAGLGAMVLGFTPALFAYVPTSYVEPALLAEMLCGALFAVRSCPLLALAALGCALGTKITAAPVLAAAVAFLMFRCSRAENVAKALARVGMGLALAAVVSAPWYIRTWVVYGSPTFPYEFRIGSLVIFQGSPKLERILRGLAVRSSGTRDEPRPVDRSWGARQYGLEALRLVSGFWWSPELKAIWPYPRTIGPAAVLLVLVLPWGLRETWRRGPAEALFLLGAALLVFIPFYASFEVGMVRRVWPEASCRFLLFPVSVLLLLASLLLDRTGHFSRGLRVGLLMVLMGDFVLAMPRGLGDEPMAVVQQTILWLILFLCVAAGIIWGAMQAQRRATRCLALALLATIAIVAWERFATIRDRSRHDFFAQAFLLHPFPRAGAAAWRYCDDPLRPRRIACTAGWDGRGHNWLWYPLLGRNLQNSVTYVPVTASGKIVDYAEAEALRREADFNSWLRRLVDQNVDTLVCLPPETVESRWAIQNPRVFARVSGHEAAPVYELRKEAAAHLVGVQGGRTRTKP